LHPLIWPDPDIYILGRRGTKGGFKLSFIEEIYLFHDVLGEIDTSERINQVREKNSATEDVTLAKEPQLHLNSRHVLRKIGLLILAV
jgi:hypothetical protein